MPEADLMTPPPSSRRRRPRQDTATSTATDMEKLPEIDLNEPTMGEKLESLNLLENHKAMDQEQQVSSPSAQPPSADSVHILLKQALHADDRELLLQCLYTRDEKVIANSTSLLNLPDVHKLLGFLLSIVQSRGAVLVCALPWLRSLLLQHASGIMSQESSLLALNSLYQLIESRVSTFKSALRLSTSIDLVLSGIGDEEEDDDAITPIIYEVEDSDTEESDDATMETDQEGEEKNALPSDMGESDDFSD